MFVQRELHLLLLILTNFWLSLTSQTLSVSRADHFSTCIRYAIEAVVAKERVRLV